MRNWDAVSAAFAVDVSIIVVVAVVAVAVVDNLHNHFGLGEWMPQLNWPEQKLFRQNDFRVTCKTPLRDK